MLNIFVDQLSLKQNIATNNSLTTTIALNVENKEIYKCIILQESRLKACNC